MPISRLNMLSKLFEKLFEPKITSSLKIVLSNMQQRFCRAKSTITNLLIFYTDLISTIHKKEQIDAMYTDIIKTFNLVNHCILILKPAQLWVIDPILS